MIKRLTNETERKRIKEESKFKNKTIDSLTDKELKELIVLIARKLNIIK